MVSKLRRSERIRAQAEKKKPEPAVVPKIKYPRMCSRSQSPEKLPFRLCQEKRGLHMECLFDESKKKWINKYSWPYHKEYAPYKRWFDTSAKAYASFQKMINKAESFQHVVLELEPDATFTPSFGKKRWEAATEMHLIYRGPDNCVIDVYNKVLSQVGKRATRFGVGLDSVDDKMTSCTLNEELFQLAKSHRFRLFGFHGIMTDAQLLGLRGYDFHLKNASAITPAGFVKFIQKLLNSEWATIHSLCNASVELSEYLFGDTYFNGKRFRSSDVRLILLNVFIKDTNLELHFTENENNTFDLRLEAWSDNNDSNAETLEQYPSLEKFLSDLAEGIPSNRTYIRYD